MSALVICFTFLDSLQAALMEIYGSYPYTSIPRWVAALATSAPMAPRPITPSFLPLISQPANAFLLFSVSLVMLSSSALALHHSIPPTISREAMSIPAITSSFTPLALAPGVLNTTMPFCAQESSGMLLTPAPARPTASRFSGSSISCMEALRTRTASASAALSVISYPAGNSSVPHFAMGFKQ